MLTRTSRMRLLIVGLVVAIFVSVASLPGCVYVNAEVDEPFQLTHESDKSSRVKLQTQPYDAVNFTGVDVGAHFEVSIDPGETFSVSVAAQPRMHELLVVEVKKNILNLGFSKTVRNPGDVIVYIVMPVLEYLDVSGAAEVDVARGFNSDKFYLDASGASNIDIDINANTILADLSGASDLDISGRTGYLKLEGSGATEFDGRRLQVTDADIDLSGASDAVVDVSNELKVDLSGSSDVNCERRPAQLSVDTSGASDVNC